MRLGVHEATRGEVWGVGLGYEWPEPGVSLHALCCQVAAMHCHGWVYIYERENLVRGSSIFYVRSWLPEFAGISCLVVIVVPCYELCSGFPEFGSPAIVVFLLRSGIGFPVSRFQLERLSYVVVVCPPGDTSDITPLLCVFLVTESP